MYRKNNLVHEIIKICPQKNVDGEKYAIKMKTFSEVAKQWLQDYFEKYPDRREIIIPKFTHEQLDAEQGDDYIKCKLSDLYGEDSSQEIIDIMTDAISSLMCTVIGMFFVNRKYKMNLWEGDLVKKRILRSVNDSVNSFLEEFDDTDIEFWGEFNDGVFKE